MPQNSFHYFWYMKFAAIILVFVLAFLGCRKDSFITSKDAFIRTTIDTLKFDTVFTSLGSVTKSFKIVNENEQKILIDEITLGGGNASAFRINVNGNASNSVRRITIAGNDSIYVFVSVTVNPTAANLPFIVSDSILLSYNGNKSYTQLQAYGQNAVFLNNAVVNSNTTFTNQKPYVILGGLQVTAGNTLTIAPGAKIYLRNNAPLVVDGTIKAIGTKNNPILFAGDRIDEPYKNYPASWPGIYCRSNSLNSEFRFCQIKNGFRGLVVADFASNNLPKVVIEQCVVDNAYETGILFYGTNAIVNNCLISNCGKGITVDFGGSYSFIHNTVVGISNNFIAHKNPVISLTNADNLNGSNATAALNATIRNNIFWGDAGGFVKNEVITTKAGTAAFAVDFSNNLFRNETAPANVTGANNINNSNPSFDSINIQKNYYDFRITRTFGPGVNKGTATSLLFDLDNNNRSIGIPDLGCYEKQ